LSTIPTAYNRYIDIFAHWIPLEARLDPGIREKVGEWSVFIDDIISTRISIAALEGIVEMLKV
jgi:hypothetical protein